MKILCVDDSQVFLDILFKTLSGAGYEGIEVALSAKEALSKLELSNFDLIITDLNMPKMDGITLTSRIREINNYKKTPILVLSSESGDEFKKRAKDCGVTGWIIKPYLPTQLLKAVGVVLSLK